MNIYVLVVIIKKNETAGNKQMMNKEFHIVMIAADWCRINHQEDHFRMEVELL